MNRRLTHLLACLFVLLPSATAGLVSTSVYAATVTSGTCTTDVDNASGVTMTVTAGGDCIISFTRTGTTNWNVPCGVISVAVLVVGGGGGGSVDIGGGGGGGQVMETSSTAVSGNVTITVGAGGAAGYDRAGTTTSGGRMGSTSSVTIGATTVSAAGGSGAVGRGGANNLNADGTANDSGYTGGGAAYPEYSFSALGSTGTGGAFFKGGDGSALATWGQTGGGGGGGGAGGAGESRISNSNGGVGLSSNITGATVYYGGGGGGSGLKTTPAGVGGNGGGGNGATGRFADGASGVDGRGGGGGGGATNGAPTGITGKGGSGIVIVRYSPPALPSISVSGEPSITGVARTGVTLTSSTGTWSGSPTSYSYQWKRSLASGGSLVDIGGATRSTYEVTEFDVGYFVKVAVIATNGSGASCAVFSSETIAVVDIAPTNSAVPVVTGTSRTGETLTSSRGSWTSSPTSYAYQWKRASTASGTYTDISSAINSTYVLTDSDISKFIKVSVIATNGVGPSSAVLSIGTSAIADLPESIDPTATVPVATATGFTFTISNYSTSYTYTVATSKGSVTRSTDDVTVTGLTAGESATVTVSVTRANYKPASKMVTGSATPIATTTTSTTTTVGPTLSLAIQAPVTTVAQGQASVATIAPTTSTTLARKRNQKVVTTSTVPRVTTTTVGPPEVDKVAAGQTAVRINGVDTDAKVSRQGNRMIVNAGSVSATLSGIDKAGKVVPLDADGTVHLSGGDAIKVSVDGFNPETLVEVWLFSTPMRLGSDAVGADGTMTGVYTLPTEMESGSHRVVVTAHLPTGKPAIFTMGILVGDISATSTLTRVLIAIPITLAIGFGFILPTQLRRRRKARPA